MVVGSQVVGSQTARNHIQHLQELRRQIEVERRLHGETWSQQYALSEQIQACKSELLQERGEQQYLRAQLELSERTELSHAAAASSMYSQIEEERNFVRRELAAIAAQEEQTVQELRVELHAESNRIASELAAAANAKQEEEANAGFLADLDAECRHWDLEIVALGEALREVQRSTMQEAHVATDLRASRQQFETEASELRDYSAEWDRFAADLKAAEREGQAITDEVMLRANCPADLEVVQREQDLQAELAVLEQELERARLLEKSQAEMLDKQVGRLEADLETSRLHSKNAVDNVFKLEAQTKRLEEEQAKLRAQLDRRYVKDMSSKGRWNTKSAPLLPGLKVRPDVPSVEDLCRGLQSPQDHRSKPRRKGELSPFIKRKLMQHDIQLHKFLDDILPKALIADKES
mmetsp:Transcript_72467/g.119966  ORF Transcript_72467/g.119966 Transcript_72467/m.119966 type:complete len:408 (-) Transcript_72467:176-1399(-)